MTLRIAMLTYSVRPRGGVVHAVEVAEALARRGHSVELVALARRQQISWQPDLNTPYINSIPANEQPAFPGDLAIEERGEGIRAATVPHRRLVGRQPAILLEAISRGRADRCLRRRHRRRVCLSELHVEPHLVIGDMAAGQWSDPLR